MRNILICLFLLLLVACKPRVEQVEDKATIKLSELSLDATLDTNDLFLTSDQGATSKAMKGSKVIGVIHDTADVLRSEMGTGSGIVDTTGLPVANQLTYFTEAAKIGGLSAVTFADDSLEITSSTVAKDSMFFKYLDGKENTWLYVHSTGAVDTGTTVDASFMIDMKKEPLWRYITDKVNGEYKWYHTEGDSIIVTYGLPGAPYDFQALQAGVELSIHYIWRLMEVLICFIVAAVGICILKYVNR